MGVPTSAARTIKYDVVQMTLVDTWASTAAGAFALSENNLYTIEAFREYFAHLKPDGMIAITRWEFRSRAKRSVWFRRRLNHSIRIGIADPRQHFVLIADGRFGRRWQASACAGQKIAIHAAEYAAVAAHVRQNPNLVWLNPTPDYAGLAGSSARGGGLSAA